ncbi:hypothetical protein FRC17_004097 [Serendipita sp. 399]|nr:hypothetical protein FRC17_004097 [Serendipita sp. 399]
MCTADWTCAHEPKSWPIQCHLNSDVVEIRKRRLKSVGGPSMFGFWRSTAAGTDPGSIEPAQAVEPRHDGTQEAADEIRLANPTAISAPADGEEAKPESPQVVQKASDPPQVTADPSAAPVDSSTNGSRYAFPRPSTSTEVYVSEVQKVPPVDITGAAILSGTEAEAPRKRRISFRSFGFFYGKERQKSSPTVASDTADAPESSKDGPKAKPPSKKDVRKIEKTALVLQSFILGHVPTFPSLSSSPPASKPASKGRPQAVKPPNQAKLGKASNKLLEPEQANQVIAKLRTLPVPDGPELPGIEYAGEHVMSHAEGPIHAVCLDCTEEEAEKYYFSRLRTGDDRALSEDVPTRRKIQASKGAPSIASANLSSLVSVLQNIHIVTLVSSPDLGFGQDADSPGPLAGSVPSPSAVSTGMMEITGQLLALGFATSKAVYPDHAGVCPPTDRMSVLTYWWGMEVCLPPPTLVFLANAKSIQNAVLNLLTAFSLFNNGVREILPFVRYISQFLDFQWNAIQAQNKGKGVVCAATWVCPAALVPRSWDFPDAPPEQAVVLPKRNPVENVPTIVFPGSKGGGIFTPNAPTLPPVIITPATLPRGAKFEMLKT